MRPRAHPVLLGLVLVAGVLVEDPAGWSPFGPAKWGSELVIALLALAAVAALGRLRMARRAMAAWGLFLAWVIVSASDGLDPKLAWLGTPQRHFGALTWVLCGAMFVGGQALSDDGDARLVVSIATAAGGLAGLWSVAEMAGWNPAGVAAGGRLIGPLGNASYLGAAESLLVPIALGVAADRTWSARSRGAALACGALGAVGLVGSGARAAWVGSLLALGAIAWVRRREVVPFLRRRAAATLLGVVIAGGLIGGAAVASGSAGRLPALADSSDPGGLSRLAEWDTAARVLITHPITGVGPEGYRIAFGQSVTASYQRRYGRDPLPDRAHDSLLDVAVTTGFPGLACYLALFALVGVFWWRVFRRAPPWLAGVTVGLAAYLLGSLFLFPLAEVEPAMWMLAGLVVAQSAVGRELMTVRTLRPASLLAVAAAATCAVFAVRAVWADQDIRSALAASASPSGTGSSGSRAARLADRAAELDPGNIAVRLAAAEVEASQGTVAGIDAGLGQVSAALGTSPSDPVLSDEFATLLVQKAELTGASPDWQQAATVLTGLVRSDPRNPEILLELGVADTFLDRDGPAATELTAAAYLAPSSPDPDADLALLYEQQGQKSAARTAAEDALRVDPNDAAARQVLDQEAAGGT